MAGDLDDLMARAAGDIEAAVAPVPGDGLDRMRTAVRRRRLQRHAAESVGALAVVSVALTAALLGPRDPHEPASVSTPTPSPSVTQTPTPTPTPTPSATPPPDAAPAGPAVREAEIDDATVLARLSAPRTGEVWTTPQRVDPLGPIFRSLDADSHAWYLVGHRGAADIYAVALAGETTEPELRRAGAPVDLYEHEDGSLRRIVCPSARIGDDCAQEHHDPPVAQDTETFYDTLTPPTTVRLTGGFTVTTTATWRVPEGSVAGSGMSLVTGDLAAWLLGDEIRAHADLGGGMQVVERTLPARDGSPAGMRTVRLAVRLPYGALVELDRADVPGADSGTIVWDDGVARADPAEPWRTATSAPGGGTCDFGTFSVQTAGVDRSAWVRAGTTSDGRPVHVPAQGRLELATTVFGWQERSSWTLSTTGTVRGAEAYPIDSADQLVADNAFFALEGPSGQWLLGLRSDAMNTVYECS